MRSLRIDFKSLGPMLSGPRVFERVDNINYFRSSNELTPVIGNG